MEEVSAKKGQASLEFLITYGWAFVILAIVVSVLVYYLLLPRSLTPNSCNFNTGVLCNDMVINYNTITRSITIYLNLTNEEPNIITNALAFVNINNVNTTAINCITNGTVNPGGQMLCQIATTATGSLGQFISGAVYLNVTNCGLISNYSYTHSCINAPRQTFKGAFSGHAENLIPFAFQANAPLSYIFCIGSPTPPGSQAYYAAILGNNAVGQWTQTTSYPGSLQNGGCSISATSGNTIFCVGGSNSPTATWYATANNIGIGTWHAGTAYPIPMINAGCSTTAGFIDCVGTNSTFSTANIVYYASQSSAGFGSWTTTKTYPISFYNAGCSIASGYIYCVGGQGNPNSAFTAAVASGVIATWTAQSAPSNGILGASCNVFNGYIYCVGGTLDPLGTYYATASSGTIGTWTTTNTIPVPITNAGCVTTLGYIYCTGTASSKATLSFYAPIASWGIGKWKTENSYPVALSGAYCSVLSGSSGGYLN